MQAKQLFLGLLSAAILGGGVAVGGYKILEPTPSSAPQVTAADPTIRYASELRNATATASVPEGLNFVAAAAAVTPAVVHVMTEYSARMSEDNPHARMDPFLRQFFGDEFDQGQRQQRGPQMGSGSGVIIAANGYIVTNNHVIDKANKIEVVMDDKRKFTAKLVGTDPNTDIALLKVEADNLPFVRYGSSDDVKVGQWVLAVGNPFNLNSTVTAGIISAKGRNINILRSEDGMGIESFLQTDAVVNPGNSGGALVDLQGNLVGINSAIASHSGQFEGYSFAVPSSIVSKVVEDLLKYKVVQRALLGVQIREVDAKLASDKKLNTLSGVYVANTTEGSAAAAAGIQAGDVITAINGVKVNTSSQLQEQVARYRPGDKIKVNYLRGGDDRTATATLHNATGTTDVVRALAANGALKYDGATLTPATQQELSRLKLDGGVKINGIRGSSFRQTGIADGFIITHIDKQPVLKPQDVKRYLDEAKGNGGALVKGVYPDGRESYYPIGQAE